MTKSGHKPEYKTNWVFFFIPNDANILTRKQKQILWFFRLTKFSFQVSGTWEIYNIFFFAPNFSIFFRMSFRKLWEKKLFILYESDK